MSVDSKLFVVVEKERVLDVIDRVIENINKWVREELDSYWENHTDAGNRIHFLNSEDYAAQSKMFTNGVKVVAFDMELLTLCFGCGDINHRMLRIFPRDFHDYDNITQENKLLFTIGKWGRSEDIMRVISDTCKGFGKVYYDHNDCDDKGFVELENK